MKMEKADILEMTVTFLKSLQKSQNCLNHPISSAAVTQNFHTFQEATSTTLLSEDSPGRDAMKVSSIQDKKQKLDLSGINSPSPSHSPLSQCNEQIFSCMGCNGVHGKISSKKISETRIEHNVEDKQNIPLKKEICWRPW